MRTGAVLLHYRFWPEARPAIDSLLSQSAPPEEVVIVDNHSADGSAEMLARAYPHIEVVRAPENRGYAGGMNLGIARLMIKKPDAILLLTHECRMHQDALRELTGHLAGRAGTAAAGPLVAYVSSPQRVWSAGGLINRKNWRPVHISRPPATHDWRGRGPHRVDWLDGCCILLRTAALEEAGPLDERYFLYLEEVDFLLRINRLGWNVDCLPAALAFQEPSAMPAYLEMRNHLEFIRQNAPRRYLLRQLAASGFCLLRTALALDPAARSRLGPAAKGLGDFVARRLGPPSRPGQMTGPARWL